MSPSTPKQAEVLCHCGRPLHYKDLSLKAQLEELVAKLGPNIEVQCQGRTYLVQRHYIALHGGIKGKDLATLGFREVARS